MTFKDSIFSQKGKAPLKSRDIGAFIRLRNQTAHTQSIPPSTYRAVFYLVQGVKRMKKTIYDDFCFTHTYRVVFLSVPTQKLLSTRKNQSTQTVPMGTVLKYLSMVKIKILQLFHIDREVGTVQILPTFFVLCFFQGGNSSNTSTFWVSLYLPADTQKFLGGNS